MYNCVYVKFKTITFRGIATQFVTQHKQIRHYLKPDNTHRGFICHFYTQVICKRLRRVEILPYSYKLLDDKLSGKWLNVMLLFEFSLDLCYLTYYNRGLVAFLREQCNVFLTLQQNLMWSIFVYGARNIRNEIYLNISCQSR